MTGCSVTSVEQKVKAQLEVKRRVYRAFIFKPNLVKDIINGA